MSGTGCETSDMDPDKLDRDLLDAHAERDLWRLLCLYTLAGDQAEARRDRDAACFYLTHAYVFALEHGAPEAEALENRLTGYGRM